MVTSRAGLLIRCAILISLICLLVPGSASADGGIILPDPNLWALIDEGQQIAVIHLDEDDTAQVDLFISMVDNTNKSHEVTFFLPLGVDASDFGVVEETSLAFDEALTEELDQHLKSYANQKITYKNIVQGQLLLGTILTNGIWSWAIASPLILSSCAGAPAPVATFETESSQIAIYDMNDDTDIDALVAVEGLDPSVTETLEKLRGQQIAVIDLQTQPPVEDEWGTEAGGQPGIHLTWTTAFVPQSSEATYAYPLGTGAAWASPIELTRIYVVAEPGTDFEVSYPKLGSDLSGMGGRLFSRIYWKVDDAESPAYAADDAYGSYGRIWRGTYIKSNSSQDLIITRLSEVSDASRSAIRRANFENVVTKITWIFALIGAASSWLVNWRWIMNRFLSKNYRWREGRLYADAVVWSVLYPVTNVLAFFIVGLIGIGLFALMMLAFDYFFFLEGTGALQYTIGFLIAVPLILALIGMVNAFFFSRTQAKNDGFPRRRSFGVYMLVVLIANLIYLAFAVGYAAIVGAI